MDVDQFVSSMLVEIAKGVASAVSDVRDAGGIVNPPTHCIPAPLRDASCVATGNESLSLAFVEFDFEVEIPEGTTADESPAVASVVSAHAHVVEPGSARHSVRVRFKVPLALPADPQAVRERAQQYREADHKRQYLGSLTRPSWARP